MTDSMTAKLVWDGGDEVRVPEEMGTPREDQLQGTAAERLSELCGRVCYDSLGAGRPSFSDGDREGYHDHILKVGHLSVLEHYQFTAEVNFHNSEQGDIRKLLVAWQCANRPGVLVLPVRDPAGLRITTNLRAILEWRSWTARLYGSNEDQFDLDRKLHATLATAAHKLAPRIVSLAGLHNDLSGWPGLSEVRVVPPISEHEEWVSLFVASSRGCSHELVRHGDFTAISQRSTRFVDEAKSEWVEHPLITAYRREVRGENDQDIRDRYWEPLTIQEARSAYGQTVKTLESWLRDKGLDKTSARKQARGAARGFLGNALSTELIFSASVAQWKLMLRQRASVFADAEIREVFAADGDCVLSALQNSRYGERFADWKLEASPDGIGLIAVEGSQ